MGVWISNVSGLRIKGISFDLTTDPGINMGASDVLIENSSRIEPDGPTPATRGMGPSFWLRAPARPRPRDRRTSPARTP